MFGRTLFPCNRVARRDVSGKSPFTFIISILTILSIPQIRYNTVLG